MLPIILIIFLIICVIAGFNGMPIMLIFPAFIILKCIIFLMKNKDIDEKIIINDAQLDNDTLEKHVMFEEITKKHK